PARRGGPARPSARRRGDGGSARPLRWSRCPPFGGYRVPPLGKGLMHLRRDLRGDLTRPLTAAVVAAIGAGVRVGAVETLYQRSETRNARSDVSRVLDDANSLLATRQRAAANRAEAVAGLSSIQTAYASRDAAALERFAKQHPGI